MAPIAMTRLIKRTGRRIANRRRAWLRTLCVGLAMGAAAALLVYVLLAYCLADSPCLIPAAIRDARSVILVTAHPDDETLFFGPSILYHHQDPRVTRSLLVISSGDYSGLGERRETEVHRSCAALDIPRDRCVVLNHPRLQDNPRQWWDETLIKEVISPYIGAWKADVILTFDRGGVSGHINHRAVSAALRNYVRTSETAPPAFALQTTPLLRKYSSLLDLLITSLPFSWRIVKAVFTSRAECASAGAQYDTVLLISPWRTYLASRAAFAEHESQYSWDRVLYLVVSRYMWVNTLERIV
ncbi:putative deacetylase LmbE-like domain-containing protein [Aspergillus spinulosporus]